jgi:REP element-mobilizing transposase RayT
MRKLRHPNARDKAWGADRKPRAAEADQLSFAQRVTHGGPRVGAGRKKRLVRPNVPHRVRPRHPWYAPVHVTLRRAKGLPGLRNQLLYNQIREAVRLTRREDFRIVEYSVQRDHVHMLVEAESAAALAAGMKSFAVRAARRLNSHALRRRGSVWGERYHRRDLGSPRDVRNAVVYAQARPPRRTPSRGARTNVAPPSRMARRYPLPPSRRATPRSSPSNPSPRLSVEATAPRRQR